MPKLLIVIARLNVGGTAQYISELVNGLQHSGYEIIVATGNVQGAEVEDEIVATLPIKRLSSLGRKISLHRDFEARRQIADLISSFKPDLVYSHTFKAGLLVRSLKIDVPRIHAFHGHLLAEPELAGWRTKVVIAIERVLASRAKYLVTIGERVAQELLDNGVGSPSQYKSIAPGVRPLELENREQAQIAIGTKDEIRPLVVWLARVTAVKAPQRVAKIAQQIPEAFFILAGGGDLLEEVKVDLPSNMRVVGWQPASRMWSLADLAISTSENEGMPVALIEAQLAGIPVVAVDVGSVAEVIIEGKTGYVLPEFGESYIEKVRTLVHSKAERAKLGKEARTQALTNFSPKKMVNSHLKLFDEILA